MSGRGSRRGRPPARRLVPHVESLDVRLVPSGGRGLHSLGAFIAPGTVGPRVSAATPVDLHPAVNFELTSLLGPPIETIQAQAQANNLASRNNLPDRILANPFYTHLLTTKDAYTLLNSPAMKTLIGFDQVTPDAATADTVTYILSPSDVSIGTDNSLVRVPADGNLPGFFATVPTTSIRILDNGMYSVAIPRDQIPANAPVPSSVITVRGTLADVYSSTGQVLQTALNTGSPLRAPNAPRTVPGLRLVGVQARNRLYPNATRIRARYFLRVAVERGLFNLTAETQTRLNAGVEQFNDTVRNLKDDGTFDPVVPPPPVTLPAGPLSGTFSISVGAYRRLRNVAASQTGLQLPQIGNFPGRIDVGFVFDRAGNYGLILTARGPLAAAPGGLTDVNRVGGDIQVEVSNAPTIDALTGTRQVEGVTLGSVLTGSVAASNTASGFSTYATSAGYGTGLEFGTGVAYTQVIPLGNLFSLLPQHTAR
jgi:hypothetical protein